MATTNVQPSESSDDIFTAALDKVNEAETRYRDVVNEVQTESVIETISLVTSHTKCDSKDDALARVRAIAASKKLKLDEATKQHKEETERIIGESILHMSPEEKEVFNEYQKQTEEESSAYLDKSNKETGSAIKNALAAILGGIKRLRGLLAGDEGIGGVLLGGVILTGLVLTGFVTALLAIVMLPLDVFLAIPVLLGGVKVVDAAGTIISHTFEIISSAGKKVFSLLPFNCIL